jgi:hypothetical protein
MIKPTFSDRLCFWITLAAPLWMIHQEWFKDHILPKAGAYGYYEEPDQ